MPLPWMAQTLATQLSLVRKWPLGSINVLVFPSLSDHALPP